MENKIDFDDLEVLSPAGSPENFYVAINNGADAVYLGLAEFNARLKAENFTTENIREYVKYAHLFGVKVYVTINTLISNDEFENLIDMVKILTEAKVDAFIVQDLGVAYALKNTFDGIVLHASTQMGIHNLQGALVAESLGFSRIVLSRETTLEDIKLIKQKTNLEIEYFVQGALCVAFSGNCYLSSIEHGKSGNEGKCLQLCRLPYTNNLNGKTNYALSARDLCLLENLKELIDAGVTSFKIEGRLRHAGYVATATKTYKSAIQKIKENDFNAEFIKKSKTELKTSFSRGEFNKNAYLKPTQTEEIINSEFQNHIGVKIGEVISVSPFKNSLFKVEVASAYKINSDDGLKFIDYKTKKQIASVGVGNVEKNANGNYLIYTKSKVLSGLDVHLTQNHEAEEHLLKNTKKIKLNVKIIANANRKMLIFAETKFATIKIETDELLQKALSKPLLKEDFYSQISKLSETNFEIKNFDVETDGVFVPKSVLNSIRRTIIDRIESQIVFEQEKHLNVIFNQNKYQNIQNKQILSKPTNIVIIDNLDINFEKQNLYVYSPKNYNNVDVNQILSISKKSNIAISMPVVLSNKDWIIFDATLQKLPKSVAIYINNIAGICYAQKGYNVIASPLVNIKNNYALKCLNSFGIDKICASIESSAHFVTNNNLIVFKSGLFPLMTFAHCPYKVSANSTCKSCKYNGNLTYTSDDKKAYPIKRTKLSNCYFSLCKQINSETAKFGITNLCQ